MQGLEEQWWVVFLPRFWVCAVPFRPLAVLMSYLHAVVSVFHSWAFAEPVELVCVTSMILGW